MMYVTYQTRLCYLFLFLSAGLVCIKLASSREDDSEILFYVTPTQPPNPECPKDHLCQTLQYYIEKKGTISYDTLNKRVTLIFLSENHTVPECQCSWTRYLYFSDYLSMVGLGGNIVIQNLLDIEIHIDQLSIENIIFYNGQLVPDSGKINRNIKLYIDSVQLIECFLSINYVELGEIVKLQAHNSHVSVTNNNSPAALFMTSIKSHGQQELLFGFHKFQ